MSYRLRKLRKRAERKKRLHALLFGLFTFLFLLLGVGVTAFGVVYGEFKAAPDITKLISSPAQTTKIYAADGSLLTTLFYEQDREVVPLSKISKYMQMATVSIEDERFYQHKGFDLRGIFRALSVNMEAGQIRQGASTITEQYVKTILNDSDRGIANKVKEATLAYAIEKKHSKDEILEKYLNAIYFGQSSYGVEIASKQYFNKKAQDLTLPEAAMLAGIIRSPSIYSPYANPDKTFMKRNEVLLKMLQLKKISRVEYDAAKATPLNVQPPSETQAGTVAPYFVEYVKQLLLSKYGDAKVFKGGLRVYTTIDPTLQSKAEDAAWNILDEPGDPSAALVSLDPTTGYIKAMVGGRDFSKNKFNLATQAKRQPGSTFKTFVLATALEKDVSPDKAYEAGPLNADLGDGQIWHVNNYSDGEGGGEMSLRSALVHSVNCVFARLILDIGTADVVKTAEKMGVTTPIEAYPSIALGGLHNGVSPLEMASAYGTIANHGLYVTPTPIVKITDGNDKIIEESKPRPSKAIEPSTAATLTDIMQDVVSYGTGVAARIGRPVAGKTGTAEEYRDAWFTGFTPELATAVWVGYGQGQISMMNVHGIPVTGGSFPAKIWAKYMSAALEDQPVRRFEEPKDENVETVAKEVCVDSGQLPTKYCPRKITRYFLKGSEPSQECLIHTKPTDMPIPNVVGMSQEKATSLLKKNGFTVKIAEVIDPESANGQVVSQTPAEQTVVTQGTVVTLMINRRPQ